MVIIYFDLNSYRAIFFDLRYMRDVASPYPYMLCSEKTFSDFLNLHSIKKSTRVVLYD